jgi:hypothetical protein
VDSLWTEWQVMLEYMYRSGRLVKGEAGEG